MCEAVPGTPRRARAASIGCRRFRNSSKAALRLLSSADSSTADSSTGNSSTASSTADSSTADSSNSEQVEMAGDEAGDEAGADSFTADSSTADSASWHVRQAQLLHGSCGQSFFGFSIAAALRRKHGAAAFCGLRLEPICETVGDVTTFDIPSTQFYSDRYAFHSRSLASRSL